MTIEVSHVISRCAHCSRLTKTPLGQFTSHIMASYMKARMNEDSEIVILCDDCRKKQSGFEIPPQPTE